MKRNQILPTKRTEQKNMTEKDSVSRRSKTGLNASTFIPLCQRWMSCYCYTKFTSSLRISFNEFIKFIHGIIPSRKLISYSMPKYLPICIHHYLFIISSRILLNSKNIILINWIIDYRQEKLSSSRGRTFVFCW